MRGISLQILVIGIALPLHTQARDIFDYEEIGKAQKADFVTIESYIGKLNTTLTNHSAVLSKTELLPLIQTQIRELELAAKLTNAGKSLPNYELGKQTIDYLTSRGDCNIGYSSGVYNKIITYKCPKSALLPTMDESHHVKHLIAASRKDVYGNDIFSTLINGDLKHLIDNAQKLRQEVHETIAIKSKLDSDRCYVLKP